MKKIIYSGKYLIIKEPYKPFWFFGAVFFGASFLLFQTRMPKEGFEQRSIEFWFFAIIIGIVIEIVLYALLFSHHRFMIEKDHSKIYFIQDFKKIEINNFEKWWGYHIDSKDEVNLTEGEKPKRISGYLPTYLFIKLKGENFEIVLGRQVKKWEDVPSGWEYREYHEDFSRFSWVRKLVSVLGKLNFQ